MMMIIITAPSELAIASRVALGSIDPISTHGSVFPSRYFFDLQGPRPVLDRACRYASASVSSSGLPGWLPWVPSGESWCM